MITRIEIDGFKTFSNFSIDLEPFQVIIGTNGCGKSNLFDALDLLSGIATSDVKTALNGVRGAAAGAFTVYPDGSVSDRIRIAVELLVSPVILNEAREQFPVLCRRLRYEIMIASQSIPGQMLKHYGLIHESLTSIPKTEDIWLSHHPAYEWSSEIDPEARYEFVSVASNDNNEQRTSTTFSATLWNGVLISGGNWSRPAITLPVGAGRTSNLSVAYHIGALRAELRNRRTLGLFTTGIRAGGAPTWSSWSSRETSDLPETLVRLQETDACLLQDISRDVSRVVPNIRNITVEVDERRNEPLIMVETRDGRTLPSWLLSDGTIRMLALATIRHDPEYSGNLCIEEPEQGLHPAALKRLVQLLREITADEAEEDDVVLSNRQVLITTHSPELVSQLDIEKGELLFAELVFRISPDTEDQQITKMMRVKGLEDNALENYTVNRVLEYLNNPYLEQQRSALAKHGHP